VYNLNLINGETLLKTVDFSVDITNSTQKY